MATDTGIAVELDHLIGLRWRPPASSRAAPGGVARPGPAPSRRIGRGLDQEDVRPYEAGDDARRIDWRATARLGRVQVKLFREDREGLRLLVVDLRPGMTFGTRRALRSYAAAELAALCAWDAVEHEARLAGVLVTGAGVERVRPGRGAPAALGFLGALARVQRAALATMRQPPGPALDVVLAEAPRLARQGTEVVVISAFEDLGDRFAAAWATLAAGARLTAVRVEDPAERALPPGRYGVRHGDRAALVQVAASLPAERDLDDLDRRLRDAGASVAVVGTPEAPSAAMARIARLLHGG
ncbi:MAG: DUF58 domain-containing protein [Alsobacter sp.]